MHETIILKGEDLYPNLLHEIYNPPKQLFVKGRIGLLKKTCISIVGTRKVTEYGERVCKSIIADLKNLDICIVSGLALGIDSIAHRTALKLGIPTIAVLGCGINCVYPISNTQLAKEIEYEGLLISEYPDKTEPLTFHFPQRNRIVSGLSVATIVIEAPEKSGSLITAKLALEQGREIFAVPGDIDRENSAGTINLLQNSAAYPIRSGLDVIEILKRQPSLFSKYDFNKEKKSSILAEDKINSTKLNLSKKENVVFNTISLFKSTSVSSIQKKSQLAMSDILAMISLLEIKGLVVNNYGKYRRLF